MSDIEKVKKLREATGAGFKDCNLAIKESGGDLDKAVEILRVKGISKASKKMSRDAKEGVVAVSGDRNKTSIIEVNCETDFVAKNDDFINFVKELSEINNQNNSDVEKLKKSKMKNDITVEENLVALIAKIGEKITIGKTKTISNSSSVTNSCSLSMMALSINLDSKAKGFDAAICMDNCLPNVFTVSELSLVSNETITANLAKLSFTTVCKY